MFDYSTLAPGARTATAAAAEKRQIDEIKARMMRAAAHMDEGFAALELAIHRMLSAAGDMAEINTAIEHMEPRQ
jgi:hypothetical protein